MEALHIVYDFANRSISLGFLGPLPFIGVGLFIYYYHKGIKNDSEAMYRLHTRKNGMILGLAMVIFLSIGFIITTIEGFTNYFHAKSIYDNHNFKTVEGTVENYHPMPLGGHDTERFDVNGVHFEFRDYDGTDYEYNNAAVNGGAIEKNLYVKISYFNNGKKNVILKLETD